MCDEKEYERFCEQMPALMVGESRIRLVYDADNPYISPDPDEWEPKGRMMDIFIRKARKGHVCSDCGGVIRAGEMYESIRGLDPGGAPGKKWSTYKTCLGCCYSMEEYDIDTGECVDVSTRGDYTDIGRLRKYQARMKAEGRNHE